VQTIPGGEAFKQKRYLLLERPAMDRQQINKQIDQVAESPLFDFCLTLLEEINVLKEEIRAIHRKAGTEPEWIH
jgi:hypothetical protein